MKTTERKLRQFLIANACFSGISGLILLLDSKPLGGFMLISELNILKLIGLVLILFAGFLFYTAWQTKMNAKQVQFIILQDWLWVVGSTILLLFQPFGISIGGNLLIAGIALIVLFFALMQGKYAQG